VTRFKRRDKSRLYFARDDIEKCIPRQVRNDKGENMYPILLSFGNIKVYSYGLFVAIGFFIAIFFAVKEAKRRNFPVNVVYDISEIIIISALLGGRLTFVLMNLPMYLNDPIGIFRVWEGGMVFYGGLIAAVISVIIYLRVKKINNILNIADIFSPSIIIGHAIGRIGCFFAGCCYGKETNSIFGVVFNNINSLAPKGVCIHPTQLYESFGDLLIFLFLWLNRKKTKFDGELFGLYLVLYSAFRFCLEFLRGDDRGQILFFSVTQVLSIIIFSIGITWLYYGYKKIQNSNRSS
jgi:phosphatidylglycerol---prolipoprotein diacylglyceryl transferase